MLIWHALSHLCVGMLCISINNLLQCAIYSTVHLAIYRMLKTVSVYIVKQCVSVCVYICILRHCISLCNV